MVPRWGTLILLVVASGDAALLNRVAQALSARRVRDALIAPLISDAPTLAEPERVDTWRRVLEAGRELRVVRLGFVRVLHQGAGREAQGGSQGLRERAT